MNSKYFIIWTFLLAVFLHTNISAQTSQSGLKTFDKDGLKFNYPADWKILDKSSSESQFLHLLHDDANVLISILSPRAFIQSKQQFRELQVNTYEAYAKALIRNLGSRNKPAEQEYLCLDFNGRKVSGIKFVGLFEDEPSQGEIYPFVLGNRLISLAYIRSNKDSIKADSVWQGLMKSISLEGSNKDTAGLFFESDSIDEGILNSRAIKLVAPPFTKTFADMGAVGNVVVKVEIDETGKVVSAKAISGHKLLYMDSENAAKKSKFTPTMRCGTAIKITGRIVYNFSRW